MKKAAMKIGFDISQTGSQKAGCGFYADGLIRELDKVDEVNEYTLYPAVGDSFWDPECATHTYVPTRLSFQRSPAPSDFRASRRFWRETGAALDSRLGNLDLFHLNNFFCPTGLAATKLIYTLYDLSFVENPSWNSEANRTACFSGVFNASINADWIVAISEYSRDHFLESFPHYPKGRASVIYPASRFAGAGQVPQPSELDYLIPDRFWLSVATLEPRKNQYRLLEAYARLRSQSENCFPLVLAGGRGWMMEEMDARLDELQLRGHVFLTGYVEDTALQWLYANCFAFVFPSLFEGFGMPVLEAMGLQAAVVCSNSTSMPEICGDATLLVDATQVDQITNAMRSLQEDETLRGRLKRSALKRSRSFSWKASANQLLDLYGEAAEAPKFRTGKASQQT